MLSSPNIELPAPSDEALRVSAELITVIAEEITRAGGWMDFARYMELALYAPGLGYYSAGSLKLGPAGDFVTAPEISQVFGEVLGLWAAVVWTMLDRPAPLRLIEAGPGRGTLMSDALRAIGRAMPDFRDALSVHLIETSPRLRAVQAAQAQRELRDDVLPAHVGAIDVVRAENEHTVEQSAAIVHREQLADDLAASVRVARVEHVGHHERRRLVSRHDRRRLVHLGARHQHELAHLLGQGGVLDFQLTDAFCVGHAASLKKVRRPVMVRRL